MKQEKVRRRAFLGLVGTAALGIGAYVLFREKSILDAKELGGLPVIHASGSGKPLVLLAQRHLNIQALSYPLLADRESTYQTNIANVARAAQEAYDTYGIHGLFVEGFFSGGTALYAKEKRITLVRWSTKDGYTPVLEQLVNNRQWNWYADDEEAFQHMQKVEQPVQTVFQKNFEMLSQFTYALVEKETDHLHKKLTAEQKQQLQEQIAGVHRQCQERVERVVQEHMSVLIDAIYTRREQACIATAQKALQHEEGIVVIYGHAHTASIRLRAEQEHVPILLVRDPALGEYDTLSLEKLLLNKYELPQPKLMLP